MYLKEAKQKWPSFAPLIGHFSAITNKQVKDIFYAPLDPVLAQLVYSAYVQGVGFPLTIAERENLVVWISFQDKSLITLGELLLDKDLEDVLARQSLPRLSVLVDEQWSRYFKLYRGFGLVLSYSEKPLSYEVSDAGGDTKFENTIPATWRNDIFIRYSDFEQAGKIKSPRIRFRSPDGKQIQVDVEFLLRPGF